jgi:L-alanine-DL-glutamate epimerase-like enolase superfamily enzyme
MIKKAKELKMNIMLGCMNESTIGSAAIVHMASLVDYLDVDGPLLLEEDIASGLTFQNGTITTSGEAGLGINFHYS